MKTRTPLLERTIGLFATSGRSLMIFLLLTLMTFQVRAQTQVWTDSFTQGVTPTATQCNNWSSFLNSLTAPSYSSVTISGSANPTGITMTDPVTVTQLANLMRTRISGTITSGGHTWTVGLGCGGACGPALELMVDQPVQCQCLGSATIRPQIGNSNWGGVGTVTCGAPSQTIRLEFVPAISITTLPISLNTFCWDGMVIVPFTTTGVFNPGNVFTAQLSDAVGSFISPIDIGGTGIPGATNINATIPLGITPGTGYRIRVVSTSPVVTGSDNGSNLTITMPPTATLAGGSVTICEGQSTNLTIQLTGTAPWSVTYNDGIFPTTVSSNVSPIVVPVSPSFSRTYFLDEVSDANCIGYPNGSFTVIVNTAPVIDVPLIGTVANLPGLCGERVEFVATATGSPPPTISYDIEGTPINSPHIFPVGATIVTGTATNVCGSDSDIFVVVVLDTESPLVLTPPDTTAVNDEGECSALLSLPDPVSSDNCQIASITNDQSGNPFPVGETIVTWTITDIYGNFTTVTQTVTVIDTEGPSITAAPDVIASNDEGLCSGTVILSPPATFDNCEVADVVNDQDDNEFPVGETIVTWTATDIHGNSSTVTQKVTIRDLEAPVITTPEDVTVSNDPGLCSATVILIPPIATDNCDVVFPTNNHPDNIFPVGETIVTWNVVDASDNTVVVTQRVIVNDTEAPSITAPADITVSNDITECSAAVELGTPTTSDNCGVAAVTNDQADNIFPIGETIVTWTVTDVNGNSSTTTQIVTVNDTEAPIISAPPTLTVSNDPGVCGASVELGTPTANDYCGVVTVTNDHPSNIFPVGLTIVTWTATDIYGNSRSAMQFVTVNDTEAPSITAGADVSVNNDAGLCSAMVDLVIPTTSDNCQVAGVNNDQEDEIFPVGVTIVTWTVIDIYSNTSTATQTITVNDTEAPSITAPADVTVSTDPGLCSAAIALNAPETNDNCAVASVSGDYTGNVFPVGETIVTWTVTDVNGNSSTATQKVTVNDTEAPSITAAANVSVSNDAGLCSATVVLAAPTTADNCGVASVANDQADNIFPVGETIVTWTVTDIHGNSSTATQNVTVTDTEAPSIVVENVSVNNDPGLCSATVTLAAPSVGDNCGVATVSNDYPGNLFPEGVTNVTWTVTDIHGNVASAVQQVTVINNAPVINTVTASSANVPVNTPVSLTTTFADNNVTSASINWGDGSALQTIANPTNPFTASHSYSAAATYSVVVTLTDACNASTSFTQPITVEAPANTGCVIGAGWFNSRPGAYIHNSKSGKASFAFVATFIKKVPQPIGATLFNFHAGNLLFTSLQYQSLVISGHKAFLKGSGKINGIGGYQFLISVVDGDMISSHTPDKFRIKIWNMAGTVIYDNQRGAPDDAEATTTISGGQIIIINKPAAPAPSAQQISPTPFGARESTSSAYPNPFTRSVTVKFETQIRSKLHIEVMGVTGVPAYSQDHEFREDGTYEINLNDNNARTGVYFLKINQGPRVEYIKLLRE